MTTPFHLALPVTDLAKAREFYADVIGLKEVRSAFNWVDFDFFGHQLSLHLVTKDILRPENTKIDGDLVPAFHFGAVMNETQWTELKDRLTNLQVTFTIGPKLRFSGKPSEQGTLFLNDPFSHSLEFKYFSDTSKGLWH